MSALVAGVDSSTQSCKVELRDAETGVLIGSGSAPHAPVFPPSSEQNPEDWWTAFVLAFRVALAAASASASDVIAISIAAQCHGLVLLDSANRVIRPAKLWNDTTSAPELSELRTAIGDDRFVRVIGTLPTAAFTISKIAWIARHEPHSLQSAAHILLPHDYLTFRLTGSYTTDRSDASGTGYYNAATGEYACDLLGQIDDSMDWMSLLPTVVEPSEAAGTMQASALAELGLTGPVLVGAGGGDQHAAALGLGVETGDVVYSFGTSGVVSALSATPVYDLAGFVDGVADMTGGYLPLVSTLNAAKVTDTFARILGVDHETLSSLALSASLTTVGPVLAAFLDGERTPDRPGAVGILGGITNDTSRADVARAAFEGVVLGLVAGQRQLERIAVATGGAIIAVGGGAKSAAYTQILADTLDRPVLLADVPEATARGAAVQAAAVVAGVQVTQVRSAWKPSTRVIAEPREGARDARAAYDAVAQMTGLDFV